MPEISIIVPVYKTENYLHQCIDSIISQTFTNWECILVDDGSPDNCPLICDEYAQKDNRVKVIHQQNSGVSAARNAGLDIAQGDYIAFVDSDDWIDNNMYQEMYDAIILTNAELVICGYIYETGRESEKRKVIPNKTKFYTHKDFLSIFCKIRLKSLSGMLLHSPINKLYSKRLFDNSRFDTNFSMGEDYLLNLDIFTKTRSVFMISKVFYHYLFNETSACNTYNQKKIDDKIRLITKNYDFYRRNNLSLFSADAFASSTTLQIFIEIYSQYKKIDNNVLCKLEELKKYISFKFIIKSIIFPKRMLALIMLNLIYHVFKNKYST